MLTLLAYFYLTLVVLTSRIRLDASSEKAICALREGRTAVFTFWFEDIFFLIYYLGAWRMPILMTPQGKTDLLTKLSGWMGLRVAKGSLEGGGRHALMALLEHLKAGEAVALPADGSRGPERKSKAGCFILAQESGVPVIPMSWKAWLCMRLPHRSGSIHIPLPFNSIKVRLGEPLLVNRHYQFNELEAMRGQLEEALNRLNSPNG